MTTNSQIVYSRKPDMVSANLGEDLALLDTPGGSYVGLNATAAHVWRLLRDPLNRDQICEAMTREFEVDQARCLEEVDSLLDNLLAAGLIEEADCGTR
jgi:hypothetical protein